MAMILNLGTTGVEFIRVTSEYSNAVLVALMPYFSDFAQKLDLPVPHPITTNHVVEAGIMPVRGAGGGITLKGGWNFGYHFGYVSSFTSPYSYFAMQDPDKIPRYFGEVKMSKEEAVQLARDTIKKLGVPLESLFVEQEPRVEEPVRIETNTLPYYRVEWINPFGSTSVEVDINANSKKVEQLYLSNKSLERPAPKIDAVAPLVPRSLPPINPEYAHRLIPIVLLAIDDYGQKLSLSIPRPLTTNHVAKFSLFDNGGWPHAEIELTNGWRFIYRNSMVNGYYAPDNLFNSDQRPILIKEFVGKWKMSEQEGIDLVRRAIAKLNYPTNLVHMDFPPQIVKPKLPGIPRYAFWWNLENKSKDDLQSKVEAEVDADKGELKSLYHDDKAYWHKLPPIDVPLSLPMLPQTNAAPAQRTPKPTPKTPARKLPVFQPK